MRFFVQGRQPTTGRDVTTTLEAPTPERAADYAAKLGIEAASIVPLRPGASAPVAGPVAPLPRAPSLEPPPARNYTNLWFALGLAAFVIAVAGAIIWRLGAVSNGPHRQYRQETLVTLSTLSLALDQFDVDNGRYPTSAEGLDALIHKPRNTKAWNHSYIAQETVPADSWGHPLIYLGPDKTKTDDFRLYSPGPDGIAETTDDVYLPSSAPATRK